MVKWIKEHHKPTTKLTDPVTFTSTGDSTIQLIAFRPYANSDYPEIGNTTFYPEDTQFEYAIDNNTFSKYTVGQVIKLKDKQKFKIRATDEGNKTLGYEYLPLIWNTVWGEYNYDSDSANMHYDPRIGKDVICRSPETTEEELKEYTDSLDYISYHFNLTGSLSVSGNIMTLLDKTGQKIDVPDQCFSFLFAGYNHWNYNYSEFNQLTVLTDASQLILPATIIGKYGYEDMFNSNESLKNAPLQLSFTKAGAQSCYEMFCSCNSLINAPNIILTNTGKNCYDNDLFAFMFSCCYSLQKVNFNITEDAITHQAYSYMFDGCRTPFTFENNTFDEIANLIETQMLLGEFLWKNENDEDAYTIELICSDKTMIATLDEENQTWTLTEK